jgi:hypothetical protein
MANEQDLLDAVAEIEAELTTHYVKDKIDGAAATNAPKRANKRRTLLQKVNSIVRDGLLQAIRGKTLLSHLANKQYVTEEIDGLDVITPAQATRLVSLTCVRLIIDIFSVMAKRGGSGKSLCQDLCALPDPSKDSWPTVERRLLEAKSHLLALRPADPEAVIDIMIAMQMHTLLQQGTLLPDEKYREAYRLVLDGVEQQLDAPGQLGPLSLAKMKEFGDQLQHQEKVLCFNMHVTNANMACSSSQHACYRDCPCQHDGNFSMHVQNSNMALRCWQNSNMAFQNSNMAFQNSNMAFQNSEHGVSKLEHGVSKLEHAYYRCEHECYRWDMRPQKNHPTASTIS